MFDNSIFDVVIGLLFVFFVCSLAVSGINEAVRKALNTRAKVLWKSLERILSEPQDTAIRGVQIGDAPIRERATSTTELDPNNLPQQVWSHPIIAQLDTVKEGTQSRLAHIPADDFARAFIDIITPDDPDNKLWSEVGDGIKKLPPSLRTQFQLLYEEAGNDIAKFRTSVEAWFDSAMGRVSAWYRNRTRWAMLLYGFVVAIGLNVSAIHVTAELYENDIVRDSVVQLASSQAAQEAFDCDDRECVEGEIGNLVETGLPVLWRDCKSGAGYTPCGFETGMATVGTVVGWTITAAALSLGASFWFTMLQRVFRLRSGK